jgi:TRAP-type mannitol/chloroaromatic compound transport system permease small subunit
MQKLVHILETVTSSIGRVVAWAILLMTLVMFAVVVLRYFFETGSIALQESVIYLHATVFMLGLAWTLADEQHVRVDIFFQHFSPQRQAWVNLLGTLLFLLPLCVVILVTSLPYVAGSWAIGETSREAGGLGYLYLLKSLIPLAAGLLGLQGIALALKSIITLRSAA